MSGVTSSTCTEETHGSTRERRRHAHTAISRAYRTRTLAFNGSNAYASLHAGASACSKSCLSDSTLTSVASAHSWHGLRIDEQRERSATCAAPPGIEFHEPWAGLGDATAATPAHKRELRARPSETSRGQDEALYFIGQGVISCTPRNTHRSGRGQLKVGRSSQQPKQQLG